MQYRSVFICSTKLCTALVKFPFHCLGRLQERHAKNLALGDPFDDAANRRCPRWIHMRHDPMSRLAFSRSIQLILCKELHTQQSSRKSRPHILLTLLSASLPLFWLWNSSWWTFFRVRIWVMFPVHNHMIPYLSGAPQEDSGVQEKKATLLQTFQTV